MSDVTWKATKIFEKMQEGKKRLKAWKTPEVKGLVAGTLPVLDLKESKKGCGLWRFSAF